MDQVHTTIALELLSESPFNPRRTMSDAGLQELAADIQALGVHTPILVRPVVNGETEYEIVFGHRRYRAAQIAGLQEIPAIVRACSDDEAMRLQISENLAREGVHPIEEAEGMHALVVEHGVTADDLIRQTGKSRSYVYGRLKLATADEAVRDACLAGEIGAEVALLIARIPGQTLQLKALDRVRTASDDDGGKISYRHIRSLLLREFALDLRDALWATDDALLIPDAGACTTCTKRSGCSPELYGDVSDPVDGHQWYGARAGHDICMDPACFAAKKGRHLSLLAAELASQGKTVVEGTAALAAITDAGKVKGAYVALSDVRGAIKDAKVKRPPVVVIQDPRTGKTVEAVRRADLKAVGVDVEGSKPAKAPARDWEAERREKEEAAAIEQRVRREILSAVYQAVRTRDRSAFDLGLLARHALDTIPEDSEGAICELHGKTLQELRSNAMVMSSDDLALLTVSIALATDVDVSAWTLDSRPKRLLAAAIYYDVDADAIRARMLQASAPASTPSPAARAPKKGKGKASKAAKTPSTAARAPTTGDGDASPAEPQDRAGFAGDEQMAEVGCADHTEALS